MKTTHRIVQYIKQQLKKFILHCLEINNKKKKLVGKPNLKCLVFHDNFTDFRLIFFIKGNV